MSALKNPRYEIMAQGLAKGLGNEAAYKAAGYKPIVQNAHRLAQRPEIQKRLAELQGATAKKVGVTIETIAAQLDQDREFARTHAQSAAAVSATIAKAKLYGLITEKRKLSGGVRIIDPAKLAGMSNADLDKLERAAAILADAGADPGGEGEEEG